MKLKIKVRVLTEGCLPVINKLGDWIDLRVAESLELKSATADILKEKTINGVEEKFREVSMPVYHIPLGISMELPKGYEAIINSRSSGPKKLKLFIPNGQGIVDNIYCGNDDQWYYIASPMSTTKIEKGDRICQFRIQLSQKATIWQKIKWLFSSGIKIQEVKHLGNSNRSGLGSTGVK